MRLVALINDFHLVSPGSSFMSSISATSISGLWGGEDVTDMTLDGEELDLLGGSIELEVTWSPPPPPRKDGVPRVGAEVPVGEVIVLGSRTLIVTSLLGVRFIDGSPPVVSEVWDDKLGGGGVVGALAGPESVGVAPSLSADMLL